MRVKPTFTMCFQNDHAVGKRIRHKVVGEYRNVEYCGHKRYWKYLGHKIISSDIRICCHSLRWNVCGKYWMILICLENILNNSFPIAISGQKTRLKARNVCTNGIFGEKRSGVRYLIKIYSRAGLADLTMPFLRRRLQEFYIVPLLSTFYSEQAKYVLCTHKRTSICDIQWCDEFHSMNMVSTIMRDFSRNTYM